MKNEEEGSIRKGREDDENNKTGGAVVVKALSGPSGVVGHPHLEVLLLARLVEAYGSLCTSPPYPRTRKMKVNPNPLLRGAWYASRPNINLLGQVQLQVESKALD